MRRSASFIQVALFIGVAFITRAAEPEAAPLAEPIVQLPPMIVSDLAGSTRWLYANVRGDEYLSRCSEATTRAFIEARERLLHRLHAIVPETFLADLPSVTLLADQADQPKSGDLVAREVLRGDKSSAPRRSGLVTVQYLPSLGIEGRDLSVLFAYLDPKTVAQTDLLLTPGYLRFRLERRTPTLPPWLVEGLLAVYARVNPGVEPVTLRPFAWLSPEETRAIVRNPAQPRALLSANEMFAPDALRGEGNAHPRRIQTLQTQVALFVRWALDPRQQVREKFWTFARHAGEQRVTEEMFFQDFGFGFSDLRDRLNDYLPLALKKPLHLEPGAEPPFDVQLRDATDAEIGRLRGTWERLEIGHVQHTYPDFAGRYIVQARQTLLRAYEVGEKDPRLLAEIGLCEIDAGDAETGRRFLESAIAAALARPLPYYEVARLRFADLMRGQPPGRLFSAAEIAPVMEPLRRASKLTPQLPEVYGLLADTWIRTREPAPAEDVEALARAAHYFAMNPAVSYRIALALARCGRRTEAAELLANGVDYVPDDAARARYAQLQIALTKTAPAAR